MSMMNHHLPLPSSSECGSLADLLPLVPQHLLKEQDRQRVDSHLTTCLHCQAKLSAYQHIDTAIRLQFQKSERFAPTTGAIMSIIDEFTQPQSPIVTPPNRNKKIIGISTIAALLVALLIVVFVFAQPHAGKGHSPSSKPTQSTTVTTNAQSATISFTRVTAPLQAPSIVTVASDGSGQVAAKQESATLANPVKSAPIDIPSLIEFPINVTNTSSSPVFSPLPGNIDVNDEIYSTDGKQGCGIGPSVQVNPGQTVTQTCLVNAFINGTIYQGFATYDDKSHPPLVYTGTNQGVNYTVPAHCGDTSQVVDQAQSNLLSQLDSTASADKSTLFGPPNFALHVTCNPPAGNVQYDPTGGVAPTPTYVQIVTGSVTQNSYNLDDVIQYQNQQLQNKVKAMQGQYTLINPQVCSSIMGINYETSTKVELSCPATGTAAWNWDDNAKSTLATSLAGKSQQDALTLLNSTPGIVPGSIQINLPPGSSLPTDASEIIFAITP